MKNKDISVNYADAGKERVLSSFSFDGMMKAYEVLYK
jgi:hypothetical protein